MYTVKKGAPIQRLTSDGAKMDPEPILAVSELDLYPESLLLTPAKYNGKWLFNLSVDINLEIDAEYVTIGGKQWL